MTTRSDVLWPMLLLAIVTVFFFAGGIHLDLEAAEHGAKGILKMREGLSPEQLKDAMAFQADRVKGIQQAATAAYDISKISLGALVASITQYMSHVTRRETPAS